MTNKEELEKLLDELDDEVCKLACYIEADCPNMEGYHARLGKLQSAIKALEREEVCKDISDYPSSYFQCSECENMVADELETKINYCPNCGRKVEQ